MNRVIFVFGVLLLIFSSCKKEVLRGEGRTSTQNRHLMVEQGFHTVKVNGSTKVFIQAGSEKSLAVKGYDNLLNAYTTEVKNGVLTLEYKNNYNVSNDNVAVYITYPSLPNIALNGSCAAAFIGDFPFKEEISAVINGSGEIDYAAFSVGVAHFNISGSGYIQGSDVLATEAYIQMSGSGETRIAVKDKLKVNISGSGNVYYKGNPVIEMNISGSGKIIPLN